MLYLKPKAFRGMCKETPKEPWSPQAFFEHWRLCKDAAVFRNLREKYLIDPEVADPSWLRELFEDLKYREAIVQNRNSVLSRYIDYAERQAAYWHQQQPLIVELQKLGGRKARLRQQARQEVKIKRNWFVGARLYRIGFESWKIEREISGLNSILQVYNWNHLLDLEQSRWYALMFHVYSCFPLYGDKDPNKIGPPKRTQNRFRYHVGRKLRQEGRTAALREASPPSFDYDNNADLLDESLTVGDELSANQRRKRGSIAKLCQWLSIPEIGLKCTWNTIKIAIKHKGKTGGVYDSIGHAVYRKTQSGIHLAFRPGPQMTPREALNWKRERHQTKP